MIAYSQNWANFQNILNMAMHAFIIDLREGLTCWKCTRDMDSLRVLSQYRNCWWRHDPRSLGNVSNIQMLLVLGRLVPKPHLTGRWLQLTTTIWWLALLTREETYFAVISSSFNHTQQTQSEMWQSLLITRPQLVKHCRSWAGWVELNHW